MHPSVSPPEIPSLGRSIRNGVLASTVVMFVLAFAMMQVSGEVGSSAAVAAMAAFWGGPGFGVMAGAAIYSIKQDRAAAEADAARQGAGARE